MKKTIVREYQLPSSCIKGKQELTIAFLTALSQVNGIALPPEELVRLAIESENRYVGVSCGKLDPFCEVFSAKDKLLYLDTENDAYERIPKQPAMKPFQVAIFFSGLERALAGSRYNMRVDECRAAAYALQAYSGMEYGKFADTYLREVPREVYETYKDRLPLNWAKRAEHWYTEYDRVEQAAQAWRAGDIETYGKLSFASGRSSIENWETGSPELKALYEIMLRTDGIYGGRFSGAGFKGCCMALIDPAFAESIERTVTEEYLKIFPQLRGKFSVHLCETADGVYAQRQQGIQAE